MIILTDRGNRFTAHGGLSSIEVLLEMFSHPAARFGAAFGDEGFAGGAFDGSWDLGIALAFGALADEDDAEPVPSGFCEGCADDLAFASAVANLEAALCPTALNTSLTTSSPRVGAIFIFISVFPLWRLGLSQLNSISHLADKVLR